MVIASAMKAQALAALGQLQRAKCRPGCFSGDPMEPATFIDHLDALERSGSKQTTLNDRQPLNRAQLIANFVSKKQGRCNSLLQRPQAG